MTVAIELTFRGIQSFESARQIVQDTLHPIEHRLPDGTRCHVVIERALDGETESGLVHARVHLLGMDLLVSTAARDDDAACALRLALARAESRLPPLQEQRVEAIDLAL